MCGKSLLPNKPAADLTVEAVSLIHPRHEKPGYRLASKEKETRTEILIP